MPDPTLVELLYGKYAHANPVHCVEDVSFELAGRRSGDFPHSIWQLLSHINYWMDYELRRIRGEQPVYPGHAAGSWPLEASAASGSDWQRAIAQFKNLLTQLAALAESAPEVLAQPVPALTPEQAKHTSSLHAVLWQTLVHNSYHIGAAPSMPGPQSVEATAGSLARQPEYNGGFGSGRRTGRRRLG